MKKALRKIKDLNIFEHRGKKSESEFDPGQQRDKESSGSLLSCT